MTSGVTGGCNSTPNIEPPPPGVEQPVPVPGGLPLPKPNTMAPSGRGRRRGRSGWDTPANQQLPAAALGYVPPGQAPMRPTTPSKSQQPQPPAPPLPTHLPPPPPPPMIQDQPPPPPPAGSGDQNEWSPELKDYVQRAFNSVNNEKDKDRVEEALKHKLGVVFSRNLVHAIDWKTEPLPQLFTPPVSQQIRG